MGGNISKDIYTAVRRATSNLVKNNKESEGKGDSVAMGEEIKIILASKADRSDIDNLNHLKGNKCDTELSFQWIDLVHKQLKQTLVLVIEMLRF